jgi:hypothetical protein
VTTARRPLALTRAQILNRRREAGALDRRLPPGPESIRRAAWAGLQDSMPRAAVLSLHARVDGVGPDDWADPALVQLWGPRFSVFAVAATDVAPFTLGRLPTDSPGRRRAEETADRLERFLAGRRMTYRAAGEGLGVDPNSLRYAAPTGRVRLRWEGAGQPVVWMVEPPAVSEEEARLELARRYLHVFGPGTVDGFSEWAGVRSRGAEATFDDLADELVAVDTPIGPGLMLAADAGVAVEPSPDPIAPAPARLLPSGDAYYLRWGTDRELLVSDPWHRAELWTSRVWPGAVLVDGEIVGTWRRAGAAVVLTAWRPLKSRQRAAVEAEAVGLPIPGDQGAVTARWSEV